MRADPRCPNAGQVVGDLFLVFVAGIFVLCALVFLEQPRLQVYPPATSSEWVQSYLVGGGALAAAIAIVAFVVVRGGTPGWRSLRRLAGVLATGGLFPALIGTLNAAYFGAGAAALTGLAAGAVFLAIGAFLLRRR